VLLGAIRRAAQQGREAAAAEAGVAAIINDASRAIAITPTVQQVVGSLMMPSYAGNRHGAVLVIDGLAPCS
jgi:hypothetical protein